MIVGTVREIWRYPVKSMSGERLDDCTVTAAGVLGDRGWALRDDTAGEIRGAKKWPVLMQCTARYREPPTAAQRCPHVDITLPDGSRIGSDAVDVAGRLSQLVGRPVSLWPLQPASNKAHYRRAQPGAALIGLLSRSQTFRRLFQTLARHTSLEAELRRDFSREPDEPIPDLSVFPAELFEFASPPGTYFDAFPLHLLTTASLAAMARLNPGAAWDVRRFRPNLLIATADGSEGLVESTWCGRVLRIGDVQVRCELPAPRCGMTTRAQVDLPQDPSVLRTIVRDARQNLGVYAASSAAGRVTVGDVVELL